MHVFVVNKHVEMPLCGSSSHITVKTEGKVFTSLKVNLPLWEPVISVRHRRRGFLPTAELLIV